MELTKEEIMENRRVNGWEFRLVEQEDFKFYECRGEVMYDDDHDQMPEPSLWTAAVKLKDELLSEGYLAEANHSEKGWVEVTIQNK